MDKVPLPMVLLNCRVVHTINTTHWTSQSASQPATADKQPTTKPVSSGFFFVWFGNSSFGNVERCSRENERVSSHSILPFECVCVSINCEQLVRTTFQTCEEIDETMNLWCATLASIWFCHPFPSFYSFVDRSLFLF